MTWLPMVSTGLSEVMGSWKIMAIRLPRMRQISSSLSLQEVPALEQDLALDDPARRVRDEPRSERALTVLPQPLSPTMAYVSPSSRP